MSHSFQKVKRKVSFHPNFKGQDTMLVQSEIDFNYHNLYIDTKEPLCKTETIFWYVWISFLLLLFAYVHNMAYVFIRHFSLNMFELIVWSRCSFIFKYWFSFIEQDVNFKYDTQTWFKFDTCTLCLFWICENPVCVCGRSESKLLLNMKAKEILPTTYVCVYRNAKKARRFVFMIFLLV